MAATALLVLVLGAGIAGAAIAAVTAEAAGHRARRPDRRASLRVDNLRVPRTALLDRPKLIRMLAVNRDIMIRTASLIAVFLFFTSQGARARRPDARRQCGAEQLPVDERLLPRTALPMPPNNLCGRAYGARAKTSFSATR